MKSEDYSEEIEFLSVNYSSDVDLGALKAQLAIFKVLFRGCAVECFEDILKVVQQMSKPDKAMVDHVVTVCKLLSVNPATNAVSERSFSAARRLKTWLRSTMTQKNFNSLAILNIHKHHTDKLCLVDVAKEFVSRHENRIRKFGAFTNDDFLN